jgi:Uma2 family endonuclease
MTTLLAEEQMIEQLIHSPRLSLVAAKLDAILSDEAERRQQFYTIITEGDKAEFINGEMIFHSPVKLRHNLASQKLLLLLGVYVQEHGLGLVGYEKLMISLTRNDYESDICFFSSDKARAFAPTQMRFPAPDFVVEVLSESTMDNDRGVKFDDYAAHGIAEYWIIDPVAETVEQYTLSTTGRYELQIKAKTGIIQSVRVPGFELPVRAIFEEGEHRAALRGLLAGR